jgi:LuxR family transcriptional regulator, quorum-sensing system regulator BjaR1
MLPLTRNVLEPFTIRLVERMEACTSINEIGALFHRYALDVGFFGLVFLRAPEVGEEPVECVLLNTLPDAWLNQYLERGYLAIDPGLKELSRGYDPFTWSELQARLSSSPDAVLQHAASHGFNDAFCVPAIELGGHAGLMVLPAQSNPLSYESRTMVRLACSALQNRLSILIRRRNDIAYNLTDREKQCLRWAAVGKSDWEIGQILMISAKTVNYHIENTKREFGVATRVQAIVAAMRSGKLSG